MSGTLYGYFDPEFHGQIFDAVFQYSPSTQGENMSYPFKVHGACTSTAQYVFKVSFSQPLSSVPNLRAYDNAASYPNTDSTTTTVFRIFVGSTGNSNKPMLHFLDTTRSGPSATNWYTASTIGAGVATCLMKGDTSYLQFRYSTASIALANPSVYWNSLVRVPYDVYPTMNKHHNVVIRYTFTSTAPTVSFWANNTHAGGTGDVPVWGSIQTDVSGVRFGSSTATNLSILGEIPLTGQQVTKTAWVTTS